MNVNRILLCIIMASLSIHAMEVPVGNAPLPPCPGGLLARQPDVRHSVTAVNNKNYYLINRDGQGLTDYDRERLCQIVPFALEQAKDIYRSRRMALGGFVTGCFLGIAFCQRACGKDLFALKSFVALCCGLVGGFWGWSAAIMFENQYPEGERDLRSTICREKNAGRFYRKYGELRANVSTLEQLPSHGSHQVHYECAHEQTADAQLSHSRKVMRSRMALGKLYVPQNVRIQLERNQDEYKPLETYLMQADSPINATLNIPHSYRGNRAFVSAMMKFIKDSVGRKIY